MKPLVWNKNYLHMLSTEGKVHRANLSSLSFILSSIKHPSSPKVTTTIFSFGSLSITETSELAIDGARVHSSKIRNIQERYLFKCLYIKMQAQGETSFPWQTFNR